jgi:hypothetical protein
MELLAVLRDADERIGLPLGWPDDHAHGAFVLPALPWLARLTDGADFGDTVH